MLDINEVDPIEEENRSIVQEKLKVTKEENPAYIKQTYADFEYKNQESKGKKAARIIIIVLIYIGFFAFSYYLYYSTLGTDHYYKEEHLKVFAMAGTKRIIAASLLALVTSAVTIPIFMPFNKNKNKK